MASVREQLATKCKIKDLEFWAQSATAQHGRTLVGHGGIGIEGERFEDLGEGARRHSLRAELYEDEYLKLKAIYTEAKRVDFTHPLFGVFQVRVQSIQYQAGPAEMVDVTITLVEDGEREIVLAPVVLNLGTVNWQWESALDDITVSVTEILSDGFSQDGFTAAISAAWVSAATAFSAVLDLAEAAEAAVDEVAASYSEYADAALAVIEEMESSVDAVWGEVADAIYGTVGIAQDAVRSISVLDSAPWNNFLTKTPVLIGSIAAEFLGADSEDNIESILEYNPTLLDVGVIPAGFELVLPVTLGSA